MERRADSHRAAQLNAGFTLLELVVVIIIISVLLATAATRLLPYLDEAERVSVLSIESQLRNTLLMEAAQRIVRGQSASIGELEQANPMALLLQAPDNYIGERRADRDSLPERRWYFDPGKKRLVYRRGEPYTLAAGGPPLRDPEFEVRVIFSDRNADGVFNAAEDEFYGVRLLRMAGSDWLAAGAQL